MDAADGQAGPVNVPGPLVAGALAANAAIAADMLKMKGFSRGSRPGRGAARHVRAGRVSIFIRKLRSF